jgi:Na+/glutamate symporter
MDGFLIICLAIVGLVVVLDKGRHVWLKYAWFTLLGFTVAWIAEAVYIVYLMPNPFLR